MERKGSAKKWGGLFKLFGSAETDTKEDIRPDEALNSVQEGIMNKEVKVQEINKESNLEHTETDTKEDIETDEALNSVQEEIINKEIEVQEINTETNPEHSVSASENITPNQQFAEVTKERRFEKT